MSNQVKARPASAAQHPTNGGSNRNVLWIVLGLVAVVVIAAIIAVVATSGGDDTATEGVSQTQPVDVQGASLPPLPEGGPDAGIGADAPVIAGAGFDGTPVRISPGEPTLVFYFAHWCPHCQREVPKLVEWSESGNVPEGLDVIAVSTGVDDTRGNYPPSTWLEDEGWPWPVLADDGSSSAAQASGLTSYPYWMILDENGRVLDRGSGEQSPEQLDARLDAALGGA